MKKKYKNILAIVITIFGIVISIMTVMALWEDAIFGWNRGKYAFMMMLQILFYWFMIFMGYSVLYDKPIGDI